MKNTIMVIPGTSAQISLIKKLKQLGYEVLCINPQENSPAFKYADKYEIGDILDKDFCLKKAEQYSVIAVMSDECDIAMPTVSYVSEVLSLPTIGNSLTELYTNKFLMREFSKEMGFPYPRYCKCKCIEDAYSFFLSIDNKKMVMKPLDSNSSRGVFTIQKIEDIESYFDKSISFSKAEDAIICEEYIEGTEFTVDGLVLNNKHYSLAISKKKHYQHNSNIAYELFFSSNDPIYDYDLLREQNDKYVEKSKLPFGFTHAEYKYDGEKYVLIEIGARGGGNFISSHIVPELLQIDNYKLLIESILQKKTKDYNLNINYENTSKCAVLHFFDIDRNNGKVVGIRGEEYLHAITEIKKYEFRFKLGDTISKAENDSARVGFYIAVAETRERLEEIINIISQKVHIELEEII